MILGDFGNIIIIGILTYIILPFLVGFGATFFILKKIFNKKGRGNNRLFMPLLIATIVGVICAFIYYNLTLIKIIPEFRLPWLENIIGMLFK